MQLPVVGVRPPLQPQQMTKEQTVAAAAKAAAAAVEAAARKRAAEAAAHQVTKMPRTGEAPLQPTPPPTAAGFIAQNALPQPGAGSRFAQPPGGIAPPHMQGFFGGPPSMVG